MIIGNLSSNTHWVLLSDLGLSVSATRQHDDMEAPLDRCEWTVRVWSDNIPRVRVRMVADLQDALLTGCTEARKLT